MYVITDTDGFKLFGPDAQAMAVFEPAFQATGKANELFLQSEPQGNAVKKLTGTFVYAHPPDYTGCQMLNSNVDDWRILLKEIKNLNMDTVIFQASVWNELQECYYPSVRFRHFRQWNVVEPFLEAAQAENLKVFLGGYGSVSGWNHALDRDALEQEKLNHIHCFKELLNYKDCFAGFYFTPETAFEGKRNHQRESFLNELYRELFNEIKSKDSNRQILMSPATKYIPGAMDCMADSWLALLDGVPLDILAPQDSIGTCCINLQQQDEAYKIWNNICRLKNIDLWANVEVFSPTPGLKGFDAAATERINAQINNAAPYAEKLICWEAPFFMSSAAGSAGLKLKKYIEGLNS